MKPKGIAWALSVWMVATASLSGIAGYGWLENNSANLFSVGAKMGSLEIGGLSGDEAKKLVMNNLEKIGVPLSIDLIVDNEHFTIKTKDIDLHIDEAQLSETLQKMLQNNGWENMLLSFTDRNSKMETEYSVPIIINESKLTDELGKIAKIVNTKPMSATAVLSDNQLIITPDIPGREFDIEKVHDDIHLQFQDNRADYHVNGTKVIDLSEIKPFREVPAFMKEIDLKSFGMVGNAKIPMAKGFSSDADLLVNAIQPTILFEDEELHMKNLLENATPLLLSADSPSRAASAVYASLLSIPDIKILERHSANFTTNYANPGLEAIIGQDQDLIIMNSTKRLLYMVAEKKDEYLHVAVFSTFDSASSLLYSEIVKSEEPAVIYSPVRDLLPDETRVVAEGRAGMTVNVYRMTGSAKELLYEDMYSPQNRIMEIGMAKTSTTTKK